MAVMDCHHLRHFVTFGGLRVSAAAAGDLQRCRELLQRKAAAPDAAYVSWIQNISVYIYISALVPHPPNSVREGERERAIEPSDSEPPQVEAVLHNFFACSTAVPSLMIPHM